MSITVSPTSSDNNYDISLETGGTKYGLILSRATGNRLNPIEPDPTAIIPAMVPRTAFKTSVGDGRYADLEPPYFAISQENWNGGRGFNDFDKDNTRYAEGYRADTIGEGIICGPKATRGTGYYIAYSQGTQNSTYRVNSTDLVLSRFTPTATYTMRRFRMFVKNVVSGTLFTAFLYNESAGAPNLSSSIAQIKYYVTHDIGTAGEIIDFPLSVSLTSGTPIWVGIGKTSSSGYFDVGVDTSATGSVIHRYTVAGWPTIQETITNQSLWFGSYDIFAGIRRFVEYKGQVYCVNQADDFSAARLFENGYRGLAAANSSDKTKCNTKIVINEDLTGKVVKVIGGTGVKERVTWRVIKSNTTGADAVLTVDRPWQITHDATTEIVILGCDSFRELSGHGLTQPVTDILVAGDYIYFAQGDGTNMIRFRAYNNAGTWTNEGTADGTNQFDYLCLSPKDTGSYKVWGAKGQLCTIYSADLATSWANLTFTQENGSKACGSTDRKITGLISYGDPAIPFVLKEGSIGGVSKGIYAEAPLGEMQNVRSELNGRAALQHGSYLYFSLLNGLEQFYNNDLRDMGPNRDEGLPIGRKGPVVKLIGYPGRFYALVNAGDQGTSSVMCYANPGWVEIYRAPLGERIEGGVIQVIPGDTVDRLWIGQEEDIYWIPVAPNPRMQADYPYFSGAQVESGWISSGRVDTKKVWSGIKVFADYLDNGHQTVTVEYKLDTDSAAWVSLGNAYMSPRHELTMNVAAYRIKYRLTLNTDNPLITPWVKAVVMEGIELLTIKYSFSMTFIITDEGIDLEGDEVSDNKAETKWGVLQGWMSGSSVLTMHSRYSLWDNRTVKIQSLTARPMRINEEIESHLASMELMDV